MAWIELHQAVWTHRKTFAFAEALGLDADTAVAKLARLWSWALDNAPDGDCSSLSDAVIAYGANWVGEPAQFVQALSESGYLDADRKLHDWEEYGGKLNYRKLANRNRAKLHRKYSVQYGARTTNGTDTVCFNDDSEAITNADNGVDNACNNAVINSGNSALDADEPAETAITQAQNDDVLRTVQSTYDVPYGAREEKSTLYLYNVLSKESTCASKELQPVQTVFAHYCEKIQPRARLLDSAKTKIASRLKTFSTDELVQGIDNFANDAWQMEHNAHRGAAWFFHSDARAEQFLNLKGNNNGAARQHTRKDTYSKLVG